MNFAIYDQGPRIILVVFGTAEEIQKLDKSLPSDFKSIAIDCEGFGRTYSAYELDRHLGINQFELCALLLQFGAKFDSRAREILVDKFS